jgi:hypothetical protein
VILFVNGKLTSADSGYTTNMQSEEGRYIGSSLFLYDPSRKGHLVKLGNLDFGEDPKAENGLDVIQVRDVAFDDAGGLWSIVYEGWNDEWRLGRIEVEDYSAHNALIPIETYAFRTADPIYNEDDIVGMGFDASGDLYLGCRGTPSAATPGGSIYRSALPTGHAADPMYPDDPFFYASENVATLVTNLPEQMSVAGDLVPAKEGDGMLLSARAEHRNAGELGSNFFFQLDGNAATQTDVVHDTVRTVDLQGLGIVNGVYYAIDVQARVFEVDFETKNLKLHDELKELFTDPALGVRVRGATTVKIEANEL